MPMKRLSKFVLLPELKLEKIEANTRWNSFWHCIKQSEMEVCPRCARCSTTGYDSRTVRVKDSPLRHQRVVLVIKKRRFWCKHCKKPFTEPVPGILPKRRATQRFRTSVYWAAENFTDLKKVRKTFWCSNDFVYKALYEKLELNRRMRQNPWPKTIGIDEHAFKTKKGYGKKEFVSMIVDHSHKRLMEVVYGKSGGELLSALENIPGRSNVKLVTTDLADPYKSFVKEFFPSAEIVADKFHVLRLLNPAINKARTEITGDKRTNPVRVMLLKNNRNLQWHERSALQKWLKLHPDLEQIYMYKEALHRLYRTRGYNKAAKSLQALIDHMAYSHLKPIKTLRKTLLKWRNEILNYFKYRITNARTEGFNNVAKVIKRMGYGFRSFENYRLRLLNACC